MKKLSFLLSLITEDNDFQREQAAAAEEAAHRLGVNLQVMFAESDAILQSQHLLKVIQSKSGQCDGIIFEAVGATALPQVARAAASAGIGWAVLNRQVEYIAELRRAYRTPVFSIAANHEEIGRIQGRQIGALLPLGGSVLCIEGPSQSMAAQGRTAGLNAVKSSKVEIRMMRGHWTEESGYKTISSWLRLSTSQQSRFDLVAAQNDEMALGARKAFQEVSDGAARNRWLNLPYLGCDGLPKTGQAWVNSGLLTATVISPPMAGQAIEIMSKALHSGIAPAEHTLVPQQSYPAIESLSAGRMAKARAAALHP
jgi:ABC-type sugar transport system substrate-binding protein